MKLKISAIVELVVDYSDEELEDLFDTTNPTECAKELAATLNNDRDKESLMFNFLMAEHEELELKWAGVTTVESYPHQVNLERLYRRLKNIYEPNND